MWGSAPWERIEHLLARSAPILRMLPAGPSVRWLELGTGTGAVALLAARAGAHVTGLELGPRLMASG
jgi:methylase of polypeptide subunit release factors